MVTVLQGERLSRVGLGGAPLGRLLSATETNDATARLCAVVDEEGVRLVDTAAGYGTGSAERALGAALKERRSNVPISTKIKILPGHSRPTDYLRAAARESARRLQRETLDILLLHDPYDAGAGELQRWADALGQLRDDPVARNVGVGASDPGLLTLLVNSGPLDYVLCGRGYSLANQTAAEDLFPACVSHGVRVLLGGALEDGGLVGDGDRQSRSFAGAGTSLLRHVNGTLTGIARERSVSRLAVAVRFSLSHPAVDLVLVGTCHASRLREAVDVAGTPMDEGLWQALDSAGMLSPFATRTAIDS